MPLLAMLAGLLVAADAGAEVKNRVFIPDTSGLSEFNAALQTAGSGYVSPTPSVLAFSSDGQTMYGVDATSGDLLVYDLNGNAPPTTHALGLTDALSIVVTQAGTKAYVARQSTAVAIVDLGTMTVDTTTISLPARRLAISPDSLWLYALSQDGTVLRRYLTFDETSPDQLGITIDGTALAVSPDGDRIVVTGTITGTPTITVISRLPFAVNGSYSHFSDTPSNVVISQDSTTALITTQSPGDVVFVDLNTRAVQSVDPFGASLNGVYAIDIDEGGKYAWAYAGGSDTLFKIDVANRVVAETFTVPGNDINGKFMARPIFANTLTPDVVAVDSDLTEFGFGSEVLVQGPVNFYNGFATTRNFRFIDTPAISVVGPGAGTATFAGVMQGTGGGTGFSVTSNSGGTLILAGNTMLTTQVSVAGATLQVDGSQPGMITVQSNGVLSGIGTVGDVTVGNGGSVRPGGASAGTLTVVGGITFETGSRLWIDVNGTIAGSDYDVLDASTTTLQAGVTLQSSRGYTLAPGDTFTFLANVISGSFDALPAGAGYDLGSYNAQIRYDGGDGNEATLRIDALPTASVIANASIDENTVYNGSVTVGDDQTAVGSLIVTATSNQQGLVPDANISVTGTGAVRGIQITPVADSSGSATITVRVADPNFYFERTFQLTVNHVNRAPTIAPIAPQSIPEDSGLRPVDFEVDDTDGCIANVIVTATSSNQAIVADAGLVVDGDGAQRVLLITPKPNAFGTVTITLRAMDDTDYSDTSFQLTVTPTDDPPSISFIASRTIAQDESTGPIAFTVTDLDGFDDHTVTASSSNQTLVPDANLTLGGAGGARTITVTPAAGQHGLALITVTVNDSSTQAAMAFALTVTEAAEPTAITYALAEGATGMFFDTDLLLANPNAVAVPVTITFTPAGGAAITESRELAPMSRTTILVDAIAGLESATFMTEVTSTEGHPIAVERTMRWGAGGYGAHTEKASGSSASTWYFAEGAAGWFSTYLLLGNPQATASTAHVEWLREGEPVLTRDYPLPPHSRTTIDTREDDELRDRAFGLKVTFDHPGIAERTMYFGMEPLFSGGHAAAGQTSLSTRWDFAEGATGSYFTTFLLLANPGAAPGDVTLTFFPQGGAPVTVTDTIGAGQRMTRNIAFEHPSLASAAVASRIESTQPIVAERAQYWGAPAWIESHNSFGVTAPGRRWALAEGRVGGADGAQTYILLMNPGDTAASVTLTFLRADGMPLVKTVDVPAASRITFGVTGLGDAAPELVNEAFGTLIESTQPIIVERSFYTNANGIIWAAGTSATATALPELH